ncbi:MAG TPA: ATP-binding protein [Acidimicrobiales bacterium]|nr:ATP-binding protein [Acidimicrobiales bacterium]
MLLYFTASNHRSILDEVELSMIAIDERPAARPVRGLEELALTTVGIYGPNASGKSNVLSALTWLSDAVRASLRSWDRHIPRDPHLLGSGARDPSSFEIGLSVNDVRYRYRVTLDDEHVVAEDLWSYPKGRSRHLFGRNDDTISFRRGLGSVRAIRELLGPSTLVLSVARRIDHPELGPVARFVSSMTTLEQGHRVTSDQILMDWENGLDGSASTLDLFTHGGDANQPSLFTGDSGRPTTDEALDVLRYADPSISAVKIERRESDLFTPPETTFGFAHVSDSGVVVFGFEDESAGTRTWFRLIGPALTSLQAGTPLLVDEIDASLHPHLAVRLLDLFRDPESNPKGAQLIFTSHDAYVLSHLNRDELWLTEKDTKGRTHLTPVSDFGGDFVRKSRRLDRAYLAGRFGAVPDLPLRLHRTRLPEPLPQ